MIKLISACFGAFAMMTLPALGQSFTHQHGEHGTHHHDTTIYVTQGTCCVQTYSCGHTTHHTTSSHVHHHDHAHHTHNHPNELAGSAHHETGKVIRTYTRTYVHPHVERHVYTRTVPSTVTIYPAPAEPPYWSYSPSQHLHTDRDQPWAHYDHKWKSRTRKGYRSGH